jgi:Ca2+-binding EF-hand superfamily protein
MLLQKQKKTNKSGKEAKDYSGPGKPMTNEEFRDLVQEADASGYISSEEFKKKCQALLHSR